MRISDWSSDVCSSDLNLRVQLRTLSGAIVVPLSAVRNGSQGDFVYLINADHTVSVRAVTRGQQSGSQVQVMTGLKLGERVVTEGGDRLKDGATVQLPGEAASTQARVAPTADAKGAKGDVAGAAAHKGQRQGDRKRTRLTSRH